MEFSTAGGKALRGRQYALVDACSVDIVSVKELEGLPTKALLGRLKRLQQLEERAEWSDASADEIAASNGAAFKEAAEWRQAYAGVKAVLDHRENLPGGEAQKELRRRRSTNGGTNERHKGR